MMLTNYEFSPLLDKRILFDTLNPCVRLIFDRRLCTGWVVAVFLLFLRISAPALAATVFGCTSTVFEWYDDPWGG